MLACKGARGEICCKLLHISQNNRSAVRMLPFEQVAAYQYHNREKSRSQSSTLGHIQEKHGFHFLMRKLGNSIDRLHPRMKLIG